MSTKKFEEPNSAMFRKQIQGLKEDVQNIAISELLTFNRGNASNNNLSYQREIITTRESMESEPLSSQLTNRDMSNFVIQV